MGLACCGVEASAASLVQSAQDTFLLTNDASLGGHILVVAGTVTHVLAPVVVSAYESLPEPRIVIAFGACAIGGGPYWDSYAVIDGADRLVPVDIHVPGCPPTPSDLVKALQQAMQLLEEKTS